MRRALTLVLTVPALWLVPSAAHAAGTCQGQPATIESSDFTITGTEGPDVILAARSAHIYALGGDDVICAAGGTIDAGAGNDSVLVYAYGGINIEETILGPGVNHYSSTEPGMIDTVTSGVPTEPNLDVIDTGASSDGVTALLTPGSHPQIATDFVAVTAAPGDTAAWDVQLPGTVSRAGVSMGTFTGLMGITLDFGPTTSVAVHGTDGADQLRIGAGTVDADLGGGDDTVSFDRYHTVPTAGRIDFGDGKDSLVYDSVSSISLDLRKKAGLGLKHLEASVLAAPKVRFQGGSGNDRVDAIGCKVVLKGGAGNDRLAHANDDVAPSFPHCRHYNFRMLGQGGNDVLTGWRDRDVLDGGAGRDKANGRQDIDTCTAEIELECER